MSDNIELNVLNKMLERLYEEHEDVKSNKLKVYREIRILERKVHRLKRKMRLANEI